MITSTRLRKRPGKSGRLSGRVREAGDSSSGAQILTASYPAKFSREANGAGYHIRFPDFPEALTGGEDLEDSYVQAADCLAEAIAGRIARGDEIPSPSIRKRGQHDISVPLYLAPKMALYLALRKRRISNTGLARQLGLSETVIRRMLNPRHKTKPERIEAALRALGKRIVVTFEAA